MNNKGFTLVELIATIALLSIVAVIAFVSINEVVKQSKVSDCENIVKNVMSASKEYVSDNRYNFTSDIIINIELDEDCTVKNVTIGAPEILKECKSE